MTEQPNIEDLDLIEKLAAIEHERWADWQKWCHKVLRENNPSPEQGDILERWDRQIETPYAELSEKEKQSDRDQVMRYWPLLQAHIERKQANARHWALEQVGSIGADFDEDEAFAYRDAIEAYVLEERRKWVAALEATTPTKHTESQGGSDGNHKNKVS